eukprot:COSAG02_NODE_1019_length_15171_cov_7.663482_22_plen_143_part_00
MPEIFVASGRGSAVLTVVIFVPFVCVIVVLSMLGVGALQTKALSVRLSACVGLIRLGTENALRNTVQPLTALAVAAFYAHYRGNVCCTSMTPLRIDRQYVRTAGVREAWQHAETVNCPSCQLEMTNGCVNRRRGRAPSGGGG